MYFLPSISTLGVLLSPFTTLYDTFFISFAIDEKLSPINLFIEEIVFSGLVIACLLALSPIFLSPPSIKATIEGVVLAPSELGITTGSLPSITDTHELVVPKSIPIILLILLIFKVQ